ncbi:MAG: hypothetical protein SHS37scaffold296_4 [Burkholderiales phage 68_11]|jgi:hypothetical protein|nr:MAG: hypothetical protein SHS37scaffold296_4 [Burkholderiales phage 68_11]
MFSEDADTFLADFGSPARWTPSGGGAEIAGLVIFDQAGEIVDGGEIISVEFKATFVTTTWPGLKRDEVMVIDGEGGGSRYRLRTKPQTVEDGVFSFVGLSLVRP